MRRNPHRKAKRWGWWLATLLWMSLIFGFSHQPSLPHLPGGMLDLLFKKTAHAAAYAALLFLWWQSLRGRTRRPLQPLILAFLLTLLYAISDEWHQTFIPGRHGQPADVLVDTAGALAMALLIWRAGRTKFTPSGVTAYENDARC